ncbi:hypothetical protein FYK26_04405 [Escherichia albertii]|nr:hypothetical protein FYK30_04420 [Escherichia albertii]QSZ88277.1 hypothetical protein FYK29_04420 [Escherichia albertii]QSZ92666.1 hypothetical protein FYK28_04415 [Escherichia albertii]QSZ97075.1 hypothetical protein FYK27_04415 [Escherichia albertii]QTA01454.1 hypothetical protein FYK26_04405 [Escherichia albertii]
MQPSHRHAKGIYHYQLYPSNPPMVEKPTARPHKTITMTQDAKPRLRCFALNQNAARLCLDVRTYYVRSRSGFFHR